MEYCMKEQIHIAESYGYYWLPPVGIYIISDGPNAETLIAEHPELPRLTLAELEALNKAGDSARVS